MPAEQHADLTPPEHVASVIHFLCGADSTASNGAAIPVYGGPG